MSSMPGRIAALWGLLERRGREVGVVGLIIGTLIAVFSLTAGSGTGDRAESGLPADTGHQGSSDQAVALESSVEESASLDAPSFGGRSLVAVKVDNAPAARPQTGLGLAEILIETPVEGGLTRFVALFGSVRPEMVGPVRSLRPVDATLLPAFTRTVVATGGQPFVVGRVAGAGIRIIGLDNDMLLQADRPRPHNVFAVLGDIPAEGVEAFADGKGLTGSTTSLGPEIPYSGVTIATWRWDGHSYQRLTNGAPHEVYERLDGSLTILDSEIVLVLFAHQRGAGYTDSAGAEVPTFDVMGSGRALLFSEGTVVELTWTRASSDRPFVLVDESDEVVGLPEGRVAVAIVPRELDVRY